MNTNDINTSRNQNKTPKTIGAVVVTYRGGGKWSLVQVGEKNHELITAAPGGKTTVEKIANVFNGAIKRIGYLDNLARGTIKQIIKRHSPYQRNVNDRGILT